MTDLDPQARALLDAAQSGDAEARRKFFLNYYTELKTRARRLRFVGRPGATLQPTAIVHEVFLIAMRRYGEFRGDSKVSTWLFRITARVIKSRRIRERVRRAIFSRHVEDLVGERLAVVTPLEEVERRERTAHLYRALDRLPDRYRTPLILYEIEELPCPDVADLLGMTVGAVWVRLHRGRARLLRELAREELP